MTNKHEMPHLTAEQREDIAAECHRLIAESEVAGAGYRAVSKGVVARIALAALTANLAGHFVNTLEEDGFNGMSKISSDSPLVRVATPLYTAPPVPVMQSVKLEDSYDDGHGNEWLFKDRVVAAILAAGGTVEGVL